MIIAVDVDGVVCDLHIPWLARYNQDFNDILSKTDITDWGIHKFVKPNCAEYIYRYLDDPTLYDDAPEISNAKLGIDGLRSLGHRVVFVTSSVNKVAGRKLAWLREHDFLDTKKNHQVDPDYVECHDKSLVRADVLIDDSLANVRGFSGRGIVFDQPWNREVSDLDFPYRLRGWGSDIQVGLPTAISVGLGQDRGKASVCQHPTEIKCPEQTRAFSDILQKMYQTHLDKNFDYSPANILATGEIGLVTRLWDKVARLMNLTGFRFSVTCDGFDAPKQPKHESIDDTLMDAAVYSIIGLLLRQGKWGK